VIALSKLDQLEVDLIDMSKWARSNNSRRYAVSIIDCFSKYAWLLPITQKKTEKVLEVLKPFLKEHTPKVLQSDNGVEFTNASMKELLDDLHIKHITSLPYKPSSNGQVNIYKVETIEPRKVSRKCPITSLISEAFVWVQGKHGPGHYDQGSGQLLPAIFYATDLLVVPKLQASLVKTPFWRLVL